MDNSEIRKAFQALRACAEIPQNIVGSIVRIYHNEGAADIAVTSCAYSTEFDTLTLGLAKAVITCRLNLTRYCQHAAPTLRYSRKGDWLLEVVDDDNTGAIPVDVEFS